MNKISSLSLFVLVLVTYLAQSQRVKLNAANTQNTKWVKSTFVKLNGKKALKVEIDTTERAADMPSYIKIKDVLFHNGSIEVKVLSRLMKNAPASSRGFIGLAFRINKTDSKFESIYIRPTNGRADDQVRRNHSIQYFSYPDYKFDKLRKIAPEKYESYADMGLNEWITIRVDVEGEKARFFVNNAAQPALIVNDLKLGANQVGNIGLWVGNYTEGYFRDLKIVKK